ncbi:unnamed protein product [Adineta steineri]|uniref:Uncharacterized protein n=1 Tax=Adineta steineri TaxID=433720 RepID=A0A815KY27_9BILA|nr:unnamed protein product [Adineta steineri]CAF3823392.1 unnamed protein product [Adineta steineri]
MKAAVAETKAADALKVAEAKVVEAQKIAEAHKAAEMKASLAEIKTAEVKKKATEQEEKHVAKIAAAEEKIAEAEKKAADAEKKAAEAEKKAAEAEKKAAEAEKKAAEAEKKVVELKNNVVVQNEQYIQNIVAVEEKKTVEERASSSASRWKKAIDKYVTEQPATKVLTRWKMIAEALQLNELGLKLYREGKLREAVDEIELALNKYEEAVSKFNEACSKQPLDIIFNSFIMVIDAFIKNEVYQEARETIEYAKGHFPDKMDAFTEAEQMMVNENWSPDYTKQYLVQLDERAVENSIKEQSDGY